MKKIFLPVLFFLLIFIPVLANAGGASGGWEPETPSVPLCGPSGDPQATGLVPCGITCTCTIENFFLMLVRIFNFAIKFIVTPLAVLMLTIGGILILISAGNQGLFTLGKNTLYAAIIGLVLAFGSWLIIGFILNAIGYIGNWSTL